MVKILSKHSHDGFIDGIFLGHLKKKRDRLKEELAKLSATNAHLLSDQKKIRDIYERLAGDCRKVTEQTELALKGAAYVYSRCGTEERRRILALARRMMPMRAKTIGKARFGRRGDGGYVMGDFLPDAAIAISCGVGGDVSWDLAVAERGVPVFQFDHSVDCSPDQHPLLRFFKTEISATSGIYKKTLEEILDEYGGSESNHILKIDIEGGEWHVFEQIDISTLRNFSQIVVEFHDFQNVCDEKWYKSAQTSLDKLAECFHVIHVHGANTGRLAVIANVPFPNVLEVTWLRKDLSDFEPSGEIFPTALDAPTDPDFEDIFLGRFMF